MRLNINHFPVTNRLVTTTVRVIGAIFFFFLSSVTNRLVTTTVRVIGAIFFFFVLKVCARVWK
jgi:hypothetical protein